MDPALFDVVPGPCGRTCTLRSMAPGKARCDDTDPACYGRLAPESDDLLREALEFAEDAAPSPATKAGAWSPRPPRLAPRKPTQRKTMMAEPEVTGDGAGRALPPFDPTAERIDLRNGWHLEAVGWIGVNPTDDVGEWRFHYDDEDASDFGDVQQVYVLRRPPEADRP